MALIAQTAGTPAPDKMTAFEFAARLIQAFQANTIYTVGAFGASYDCEKAVKKYAVNTTNEYNKAHADAIKAAAGKHYFGFDCVGLIKGLWWGWKADSDALYGGATYQSHNMPDVSVHAMMRDYCHTKHNIAKDATIPWLAFCATRNWDHIAVHIGGNNVIEATRYDNAKVRRAHILNMPYTREEDRTLPVRSFDVYALCKYIDYSGIAEIVSADGIRTYTLDQAFEGSGTCPLTVSQYKPKK